MPTWPTDEMKRIALCAAVVAVVLQPCLARAALGGLEAEVAGDARQLGGSVKSTERGVYRLHEIQLPSGTTLREFSVPGGTVFAVAWSGPAIPDLRQSLGQYFDVYVGAAKSTHMGHRHLQIAQGDLVMQSNGHMRAFSGRAYLPKSLPIGMNLEDIR